MIKVALQPAGGLESTRHYADTIARRVPLSVIAAHVSGTDVELLRSSYGGGDVPTWGVAPGVRGVNRTKWERLRKGDVVLFTARKKVFASGVVTHKIHSRALALALWDSHRDTGDTWEYCYFLDEMTDRNISQTELNGICGYSRGNLVRGFNVLDERRSQRVVAALELMGHRVLPDVTEGEYASIVRELDEGRALDARRTVLGRLEQGFLRRELFGNRLEGECVLCGRRLPIGLLVAAHIKKRAECTDVEKRDYKNNVTAMCVLGCDELFERGFIGVMEGTIHTHPQRLAQVTDERARAQIGTLDGRKCSGYSGKSAEYFRWHSQRNGLASE